MLKKPQNMAFIAVIAAAAIVGVIGWQQYFNDDHGHSGSTGASLKIPPLSAEATAGRCSRATA